MAKLSGSGDVVELSPLGRALVAAAIVDDETLRRVIREKDPQDSLVRALVKAKAVDDDKLAAFLSNRYGVPLVDLQDTEIDVETARLVAKQVAKRYLALPIKSKGTSIVVAMVDPTDVVARDDIRSILRRDISVLVASYRQLLPAIERTQLDLQDEIERSASSLKELEDVNSIEVVEDGPIVALVNQTVQRAVLDRASDIHIEPVNGAVRIRFRIDGVLHEIGRVPLQMHPQIMTRIKILSGLDISERRRPQDGRFQMRLEQRMVDLRVATLPTYLGEKAVIRILDGSGTRLDLDQLGFLPAIRERYDALANKPWGTILVTGPTGSGKSTTLYATLSRLNKVEANLITVEDPVEYQMDGVSQIQVNPTSGLSFARALRSILRADPDVILIGEIRDKETAEIAIEAALTGHLVLSSLHTNDALSTPARLFEMGVEPYLVASALSGVIGQRLARRLCTRCRTQVVVRGDELISAGFNLPDEAVDTERFTIFRASEHGCERCSHTGFFGRIAFQELLEITEPLERAIAERASAKDLALLARKEGFLTLRDVGLYHVLKGTTSLEEVLRVLI
jgi:type IV pilus assembly protein PilB